MSYHVFLAEDEDMIRCNIRENAIWKNSSFSLCGDAANGVEALEMIHKLPVDILITDIRMPFMDGLKLSEIVRKEYPEIRIIILSGYSEFDYAQKAIELGVIEYLMKPVTPSKLLQSLQKVASMIDEERNIRQSLNQLNEILERNRELPIRKYLCGLCSGLMPEEKIFSEAMRLKISFFAACYIGVVVDLSCYIGSEYSFPDIETELEALFETPDTILYFMENDSNLCLIFMGDDASRLEADVKLTCNKLKNHFKQCVIGIGEGCCNITALWKSFFSAHAALNVRQLNYVGEIIKAPGLCEATPDSTYSLNLQKELILNLLRFGTIADIPATIKRLKEYFFDIQISDIYFLYMGVEICLTVKNFLFDFCQSSQQSEHRLPAVFDQYACSMMSPLSGSSHMKFFWDIITKLLDQALQYRDQCRDSKYEDCVGEAKQYISSHFSNPDLSLTQVAHAVNISPAYFSSIFSHETGETFIEYLTKVRIEKAMELLCTSSLRTTDIAFEVGYHSTNHFGKMFKRLVQLSPREYRSQKMSGNSGNTSE